LITLGGIFPGDTASRVPSYHFLTKPRKTQWLKIKRNLWTIQRPNEGTTALSIMKLSIMTFSIATLSITTLSIMTLSRLEQDR
jgi:hypothetical protein